jgi:hypothetical protein
MMWIKPTTQTVAEKDRIIAFKTKFYLRCSQSVRLLRKEIVPATTMIVM